MGVKEPSTGSTEKPVLDESTFQQLLAAAHVLQQHNDKLLAKEGKKNQESSEYAQTLAEFVDLQERIHSGQLGPSAAIALIAESLARLTHAAGIAIGIAEQDVLAYHAARGTAAALSGMRVPLPESLAAECFSSAQILQTSDAEHDPRLDPALCREQRIVSLVAVPVMHQGKVSGVVELRSNRPNAFPPHDLRTCQLMAGLVTEATARAAEEEWMQTLAAERATMLDALDRIKPQLERLVSPPAGETAAATHEMTSAETPAMDWKISASPASAQDHTAHKEICQGCGHEFVEDELFCGTCGTAREEKHSSVPAPQDNWASLWHMQKDQDIGNNAPRPIAENNQDLDDTPDFVVDQDFTGQHPHVLPPALQKLADQFSVEEASAAAGLSPETRATIDDTSEADAEETAAPVETLAVRQELTVPAPPARLPVAPAMVVQTPPVAPTPVASWSVSTPWASARHARKWLESVSGEKSYKTWFSQQWEGRRANIYLVVASVLLLISVGVSIWGTPAASVSAASTRRKVPSQPELTFFESVLVKMGLAEPPPAVAPVHLGNPDTQVWVDLHTAIYYCPDADLYGKTASGKYTTQKDAQQDQFEPAFRKACD